MQPEAALNNWRRWNAGLSAKPVILKPLSGGRSNQTFLIDSAGQKMVLRINGHDFVLPGASRQKEIVIWQAASDQGIAPSLLHIDEQNRFLVSKYINSTQLDQPQLNQSCIDQAFELLERCHQLDVAAPSIDYFSHIEHYWHLIETKGHLTNSNLLQQQKHMQTLLESLLNSAPSTGLCHHDPIKENFVGNPDRLYLIDWEYAANGLLAMDYAALGIEWEIEDATILKKTNLNAEALTAAKKLYKYLCQLWQEITT